MFKKFHDVSPAKLPESNQLRAVMRHRGVLSILRYNECVKDVPGRLMSVAATSPNRRHFRYFCDFARKTLVESHFFVRACFVQSAVRLMIGTDGLTN